MRRDIDPSKATRATEDQEGRMRALESLRAYLTVLARQLKGGRLEARGGASDLVQEALLVASLKIRDGRGPGPSDADLKRWLSDILQKKDQEFLAHHHAEKRHPRHESGETAAPLPDEGATPSGEAIKNAEADRLADALRSLAEDDRRVLLWRHVEGLTFQQIAARLGCSTAWAKQLCDRAGGRLKDVCVRREVGSP
jgi:RNA polymerase sigma-70 factor (ECF subfamily)